MKSFSNELILILPFKNKSCWIALRNLLKIILFFFLFISCNGKKEKIDDEFFEEHLIFLTADAGPDQTVGEGAYVKLQGNNSKGPGKFTYFWEQVSGTNTIEIKKPENRNPRFFAPDPGPDVIVIKLTTKRFNLTRSDTVTITVNEKPVIYAGDDQAANEDDVVNFSGSAIDPETDDLTYNWVQTGGTSATLVNSNTLTPSFVVPNVIEDETLTFKLEVTDGYNSVSDEINVNVTAINDPPVSDAGPDFTAPESSSVTLSGSLSLDPEGLPLSYQWTQKTGDTMVLSDDTAENPVFIAPASPVNRIMIFTLIVSDGVNQSPPDDVVVIIEKPSTCSSAERAAPYTALLQEGGAGVICTSAQLKGIAEDWNYYGANNYILKDNVDLTDQPLSSPIGTTSNAYMGVFDGNGYLVKNLSFSSGGSYRGLFGFVVNATISNIGVFNVDIDGISNVGGLIGFSSGTTAISNSFSTGNITATSSGIGGLIGNAAGITGTISKCFSMVNVDGLYNLGGLVGENFHHITNSYASGNVTGIASSYQAGGFVGTNGDGGFIENSYSTGSVSIQGPAEGTKAGGFSGLNDTTNGEIIYSFSTGAVSGLSDLGGFIGCNWADATKIDECYWDITLSGMASVLGTGGVTGGSGIEGDSAYFYDSLNNPMSNGGWDFVNDWIQNENYYPSLKF